MKTTLEIADPLLKAAKAAARRDRTTVRALVERGLRLALDERKRRPAFKLRDASFGGQGLHPDAAGRPLSDLIAATYEDRGG